MEMVRQNLWLGSFNTIRYAPTYIKHVGVTQILNVAREVDYELGSFGVIKIPMQDGWEPDFDPVEHVHQCRFALATLRDLTATGESVLVHCAEGKSRSVHVLSLLLSNSPSDYEKVWAEIRSYRPCVHQGSFSTRYGVPRHVQ